MQATWRLLQFFWNRQHAGIWQSLQAFGWSPEVRLFAALITRQFCFKIPCSAMLLRTLHVACISLHVKLLPLLPFCNLQQLKYPLLSPQARPLIDALSARTREAALDLIESAYSVVGLNTVASLAGCSEGEAAQGAVVLFHLIFIMVQCVLARFLWSTRWNTKGD